MFSFFNFILLIINTYFIYKLYNIYTALIQPLLLKKSFDNTNIEDLEMYKDFFDIDKK